MTIGPAIRRHRRCRRPVCAGAVPRYERRATSFRGRASSRYECRRRPSAAKAHGSRLRCGDASVYLRADHHRHESPGARSVLQRSRSSSSDHFLMAARGRASRSRPRSKRARCRSPTRSSPCRRASPSPRRPTTLQLHAAERLRQPGRGARLRAAQARHAPAARRRAPGHPAAEARLAA